MSRYTNTFVVAAALLIAGASAAFAVDDEVTPDNAANPDFTAVKALVDAGDFDQALPKLVALDQASPNNPDILNLMGYTYRKTGKTDAALDYYNRALNLEPKHLGANEYLGELYLELKQPDKAKERLAVLKAACGDCEEYQDLKTKIDQTAAN
ncbi:MAG TPA: tetratricopeptide repeat protein [Dongiaceae bacterium]|nr:tetratricopeptide repeat protein [Dongiaceae bacterium]